MAFLSSAMHCVLNWFIYNIIRWRAVAPPIKSTNAMKRNQRKMHVSTLWMLHVLVFASWRERENRKVTMNWKWHNQCDCEFVCMFELQSNGTETNTIGYIVAIAPIHRAHLYVQWKCTHNNLDRTAEQLIAASICKSIYEKFLIIVAQGKFLRGKPEKREKSASIVWRRLLDKWKTVNDKQWSQVLFFSLPLFVFTMSTVMVATAMTTATWTKVNFIW